MRNHWRIILPAGCVILFCSSCSKNGAGGNGDDGNTPYTIIDVQVGAVTDSSVTLKWTATGDDSDVGTAAVYDIRHHRTWISAVNWDSATQVTGEPSPKTAGQTDSMVIKGLTKDSMYYFAIRAGDEAGNWNEPSNSVGAMCLTDYVVTFPDPTLDSVLREILNIPSGDIHRVDLVPVTFVGCNWSDIADLSGLESCPNLNALFVSSNNITDLNPLTNLKKLLDVQVGTNDISNLAPLAGCVSIKKLVLRQNPISDLTPLTGLINLNNLNLDVCQVSDIAPLIANAGLGANDTLDLRANPLSQFSIDSLIPQLESRGVLVLH